MLVERVASSTLAAEAEQHWEHSQKDAAWATLKAQAGPEMRLLMMMPANGRDNYRKLGVAFGRLSEWNAFKHDGQSNLDQAVLHRAQAQREAAWSTWSTLKAQTGPRYEVRMMMPCNGRDNYKHFGQWRDWSAFKHDEQRTLERVGQTRAQAQTYAAWSTLKAQKMQSEL